MIGEFEVSPLQFSDTHSLGFALGKTVTELETELKHLRAPTPGLGEGRIAAHLRAGGMARIEKIEMLLAYMRHNKLTTWTPHAPVENAFTRSLKASMAAEDIALGKMPEALSDLHMAHATSLARIDAAADELEQAILANDEIEKRVREAVYSSGAGDKDFRHAIDSADVRSRIRARFADGVGQQRDRTSVSDRARIWDVILAKFKTKGKKAA